jgi:Na+/melibiose symporter-like transporter
MNPVKLIQFFILLIVNFIIVTLINYAFLVWVNKTDTTISSVLVKSAIIAVVLTVLFTFYNKKKDKTDE